MTLKRVGMEVEYMKIATMSYGVGIYLYVTKERIVNGGIFIHMKLMQNWDLSLKKLCQDKQKIQCWII